MNTSFHIGPPQLAPTKTTLRERLSKGVVEWSEDFERIKNLPRRPVNDPEAWEVWADALETAGDPLAPIVRNGVAGLVKEFTARLKRPEGTQTLREAQALTLWEACQMGGVLAPLATGSGKCVDADTEVFDVGAGRRRRACELGDFLTYAKGEDGKFVLAKATAVESGSKFCLRLVLKNGNSVVLSADHPVFTQRGWTQAAALEMTDLIAVPRFVPSPECPLVVSDDEVKLAAYLLADGSLTNPATVFTDENPAVLEELVGLATRLSDSTLNGGVVNSWLGVEGPIELKSKSKARNFRLRGLSWFRRKWGINGLSKHKRVPAVFWGLSNNQTALFLNRFCACDGHVGTRSIEVALASEKLIDDLQFMFLRLGVMARKRYKRAKIKSKVYDAWRLTVSGEDVDRFFASVGKVFGSEVRSEKLIASRKDVVLNTNVDVVPVGQKEHSLICDEMGWPSRATSDRETGQFQKGGLRTQFKKEVTASGGDYVSRTKFKAGCEKFGYAGSLAWLADSDLAWERLDHLEPAGFRPVFDLSVPGPHNFVGNGIVLHNTLLGMLLPMCMPNCKRAVLLIPPDLRPQFAADWESYGKHWVLPNLAGGRWFVPGRPVLHVIAYSELSHAKSSALLDQIDPDLVMGDEISALRNFTAARVIRFNRFFLTHPKTRFAGWDATVIGDSIEDFWHLLVMALGNGSPLPVKHSEVMAWARALDPSDKEGYFMPGVLEEFCEPGESIRSGFQRRLVATAGVVATEENALNIPLIFQERKPPLTPLNISVHLATLRRKTEDGGWKRPDGEELRTPVEVISCARQLAQGLYLRWRFPHGEPTEVIDTWFARRQEWNRELRAVLRAPRVHMDSPLLCENAAARYYTGGCPGCARGPEQEHESGCKVVESHPLWPSFTFKAWRAVEDTVHHVTEVVWESDWLLRDAAAWAREAPGIVWVDHPAFGNRLAQLTGLPYYGGGDESAHEIIKEDGSRSIICSVQSNKKGKNLQAWHRNLLVAFPSSNDVVEQVVGRTYRSGQYAPQVTCDYYLHTPELEHSFETAQKRAAFVAETLGTAQKLVYGEFRGAA